MGNPSCFEYWITFLLSVLLGFISPSILSHAMLEGTDTYLWSKRQPLLGPRLQHAVAKEYLSIKEGRQENSNGEEEKVSLYSYLYPFKYCMSMFVWSFHLLFSPTSRKHSSTSICRYNQVVVIMNLHVGLSKKKKTINTFYKLMT